MQDYEIMLITPMDKEDVCRSFIDKISKHINSIGRLLKTDDWGLKRLAYEIQGNNKGHYWLLTFSVRKSADYMGVKELDGLCKIDDCCLRHMIIRKGE